MTPGASRRSRRPAPRGAFLALAAALLVGPALPALGDLPATSSPVLTLVRTIQTRPFVGTTIYAKDAEGSAFVPSDVSLWLVGDNERSAYEVNPYDGTLKAIVPREAFEVAPRFGGTEAAGPNRSGDLESLAYDAANDVLYAFSGTCCSSAALPTAFRLVRDTTSGSFVVDSWQPLPTGADYTAAAWNPGDGQVYVGKGRRLRTYDFATNTSGSPFRIRNVSGILGLDFWGEDLFVVTNAERMVRVNWATRSIVTGWDFGLATFGIGDSRGVVVIPNPDPSAFDQIYVYDGYDGRAADDPLRYAVYVFDVSDGSGGGGGGGGGGELVGNPGFEVDTSGWDGNGVATLSRVSGGHGGSWSAFLENATTTSGNCVLNDSPNWVGTTVAGTYTGSLWVRADAAGATLKLRFREYSGGTLVGSAVVTTTTLTTDWQQVTVQIVPQAAGNSTLDFTAFVPNAPVGACFYADDASISVA
ncbi:MAG TPA: hypothetical protein VNP94_10230 [Actinomycetota bacterium]|nr:hypothetical protein [Actinomycetota bacterium]